MNLRRDVSHIIRRPNRPEPMPVIPRRKPSLERNGDGTWDFRNMPHSQLMRLYDLTLTSRDLYPLTYEIEQAQGWPHATDDRTYEPYDYDAKERGLSA